MPICKTLEQELNKVCIVLATKKITNYDVHYHRKICNSTIKAKLRKDKMKQLPSKLGYLSITLQTFF